MNTNGPHLRSPNNIELVPTPYTDLETPLGPENDITVMSIIGPQTLYVNGIQLNGTIDIERL